MAAGGARPASPFPGSVSSRSVYAARGEGAPGPPCRGCTRAGPCWGLCRDGRLCPPPPCRGCAARGGGSREPAALRGWGLWGRSRVACTNPDDARGFAPLRIADFQEVLGEPTVALSKLRELCFSGECCGERPQAGEGAPGTAVPPGRAGPVGDTVDNPSSSLGKLGAPRGGKSVARPVREVTSASRGERWANVVISLPGVPQEFPLMVGCAACAGRCVLLGALFFLASGALG